MAALGQPLLRSCTPAAPQRRHVAPVRAQLQPRSSAGTGSPPAVPAVGWLWDRKAADTRKRLAEQNLRPKKSLGQNFMLDDGVLAGIVAAAGVQPGDLVLEIGPGTGNLTRHLLSVGALVTAVEKDYALGEQLAAEFAGVPQLRLVVGDILRQDLPALLDGMRAHARELAAAGQQQQREQQEGQQQQQADGVGSDGGGRAQDVQQPAAAAAQQQGGPQQQQQQHAAAAGGLAAAAGAAPRLRVVANLPYYITKDCLLRMLPLGGQVDALCFMLQHEVGVRLTQVEPGAADWRAMNLLTQYYSRPRYLTRIDRRKYLPAPKVDGAVVAFDLLPPSQRLEVPSEAEFLKLVKKAFSQRRKVARNSLRPLWEPADVAVALRAAGLNEDARAQDLTLAEFGALAWALQRQAGGAAGGGGEDEEAGSDGENL